MRTALASLTALALLLPAADAAAQSGKFCDPSWCMSLTKAQRSELGGKLVEAVAALKLPFRDPLKPISIQPKGMPWRARALKKLPRKARVRAAPRWAAAWDNGGFPSPLRYMGSFKLPKKLGQLTILVDVLPVAAGVPKLDADPSLQVREDRDDYLAWEQCWMKGKAADRPTTVITYNLVVGARLQGLQGIPGGKKPQQLAPVRSVKITLTGPRRVVDGIARRIDIRALKKLVRQ